METPRISSKEFERTLSSDVKATQDVQPFDNSSSTLKSASSDQEEPSCIEQFIGVIVQFFLWLFCCGKSKENRIENERSALDEEMNVVLQRRTEERKKIVLDIVKEVIANKQKHHLYLVLKNAKGAHSCSFNPAAETFESFEQRIDHYFTDDLLAHLFVVSPVETAEGEPKKILARLWSSFDNRVSEAGIKELRNPGHLLSWFRIDQKQLEADLAHLFDA